MKLIKMAELKKEILSYSVKVKKGSVFIYPTDTIYGIGCNALISSSVERIRRLKKRPKTPFSVIAPSKKWILENCVADARALCKLPGPYTLLFKLKGQCVAKNINPGIKTLGVRMPNHWITDFVAKLKVPIVTTSVNKSSEKHMTSLSNLDKDINTHVDFIIYEGPKYNNPSTIIDCTKPKKWRKKARN